jgi:hypothetical protein
MAAPDVRRGADPNDPEVVYHTPEEWDMDALRAVVESGRLTKGGLVTDQSRMRNVCTNLNSEMIATGKSVRPIEKAKP